MNTADVAMFKLTEDGFTGTITSSIWIQMNFYPNPSGFTSLNFLNSLMLVRTNKESTFLKRYHFESRRTGSILVLLEVTMVEYRAIRPSPQIVYLLNLYLEFSHRNNLLLSMQIIDIPV
jgi:hypothetical protein